MDDDRLLEEAEKIIKKECFFDYNSEAHREQLMNILKGERRDGSRFDPWCAYYKEIKPKPKPSGKGEVSVKYGDDIVHISISGFKESRTVNSVYKALKCASERNARIILDLRDNHGGDVHLLLLTLCLFAKKWTDILLTEKFKNKERVRAVFETSPFKVPGPFSHCKMAVLINGWTISAPEPVAGVLKEWGFPVIGETSYGKGVAQDVFPLGDGSGLKVTIFEGLLGNNRTPLNKKGVEPDHPATDSRKLFPGLTATVKDRQFMKAVEILQKK